MAEALSLYRATLGDLFKLGLAVVSLVLAALLLLREWLSVMTVLHPTVAPLLYVLPGVCLWVPVVFTYLRLLWVRSAAHPGNLADCVVFGFERAWTLASNWPFALGLVAIACLAALGWAPWLSASFCCLAVCAWLPLLTSEGEAAGSSLGTSLDLLRGQLPLVGTLLILFVGAILLSSGILSAGWTAWLVAFRDMNLSDVCLSMCTLATLALLATALCAFPFALSFAAYHQLLLERSPKG